jgi:hypothetical protein
MAIDPTADTSGSHQSFTLGTDNTFSFLPGSMLGVSCPACFRDQLLKEVVARGECTQCGADLELTLTARVDGSTGSG